jgi:uncharacterized protein YqjF (DUF2071 family)
MEHWVRRQLVERQYPPGQSPVMLQRWLHLLFIHWPFPPQTVQMTLPRGLEADTFNGNAWIGIVPFFMRGVRPAGFPSVPSISNFLELNLRTYVRDAAGRPGIWFYSLDANQALAVCIARAWFALPYEFADMKATASGGEIDYWSRRFGSKTSLHYRYRPTERLGEAKLGALEFFLIERYRLFAHRRDKVLSGRVSHSPYRLRKVAVIDADPGLFALNGFDPPSDPPAHAIYADCVDVSVFPLEPCLEGSTALSHNQTKGTN